VKGTSGRYQLVILHPSHFLIDNFPVVIKHPTTGDFTCFYASQYKDGLLCEGSPTGDPLPPFRPRGNRDIPLNPILVNFAAYVRMRRLIRQDPKWGSTLSNSATYVLQSVVTLHAAVLWNPKHSHEEQFLVKDPGNQPPLHRDPRDCPPRTPTAAAQPSSSSPGAIPEINTGVPTTVLDRYLELAEAGNLSSRSLDCTAF
jgi:hypothetical protein